MPAAPRRPDQSPIANPAPGVWLPTAVVRADVAARWPDQASWDPVACGATLAAAGFTAAARLPGARFGVVVAGSWRGVPAVAKSSADPDPSPAAAVSHLLADLDVGPAVLHADAPRGLLVQHHVRPGTTLRQLRPLVAGDAAALAQVLSRLTLLPARGHAGAADRAPSLRSFLHDRLLASGGDVAPGTGPVDATDRAQAQALLAQLPDGTRVIHGDCSGGNLVRDDNRWYLIDPRPLIGDWHYDVAVSCLKAHLDPDGVALVCREAGADRDTVSAWMRIARSARV